MARPSFASRSGAMARLLCDFAARLCPQTLNQSLCRKCPGRACQCGVGLRKGLRNRGLGDRMPHQNTVLDAEDTSSYSLRLMLQFVS